ncbi:response regulator [Bosea vaviloviae]|uniref:response regulator n=1 Tax=Bosea vaviloviae TaxID=1526658 RepID=UPI0024A74FB5|nr:response regulator [Bosea vaviloviae]
MRLSQGSTPSLMDVLRQAEIDLVILDLMLPGRSSFDLCGDVRAASQVPIMMLTARSEESDRAGGGRRRLRHKAVQPARTARARQAVLRRSRVTRGSAGGGEAVAFDGWRLDLRRRELTSPLGTQVDLSTGEFDLLVAFVEHANRVCLAKP